MNVIHFPICRHIDGRYWHGGRWFLTQEGLLDSLSDKDYRRMLDWQRRNWAWLSNKKLIEIAAHSGGNAA
jgi:hypothetical protein